MQIFKMHLPSFLLRLQTYEKVADHTYQTIALSAYELDSMSRVDIIKEQTLRSVRIHSRRRLLTTELLSPNLYESVYGVGTRQESR